jgi:glycerol-3-phosphate dehydrogenase
MRLQVKEPAFELLSVIGGKIMKFRALLTIACAAACALPAQTPASSASTAKQNGAKQNESPATKEIREEFYAVTNNIRKAAEKMPESNYSFKPVADMRSFGELLAHVADVQAKMCGSIIRDKKSVAVMSGGSKAEIQKALAASFDECYEAFTELSAENQNQAVAPGGLPRIAALTMVLGHNNEEYGYMAVYLRLKGIAPPSTSETSSKEYKGK